MFIHTYREEARQLPMDHNQVPQLYVLYVPLGA